MRKAPNTRLELAALIGQFDTVLATVRTRVRAALTHAVTSLRAVTRAPINWSAELGWLVSYLEAAM